MKLSLTTYEKHEAITIEEYMLHQNKAMSYNYLKTETNLNHRNTNELVL